MTRCPTTATDGRRCVRPLHEGGHLLAAPMLSHAASMRIAAAWGWQGRMAESAVARASAAGPVTGEGLVGVLEALCAHIPGRK